MFFFSSFLLFFLYFNTFSYMWEKVPIIMWFNELEISYIRKKKVMSMNLVLIFWKKFFKLLKDMTLFFSCIEGKKSKKKKTSMEKKNYRFYSIRINIHLCELIFSLLLFFSPPSYPLFFILEFI